MDRERDTIKYKSFFLLELCYNAILNLQYLAIAFPDAIHFGVWNAKYQLHLALAFPNANALTMGCLVRHFKSRFLVFKQYYMRWVQVTPSVTS